MTGKKDNNFNLVRFYLSLSVLLFHAFELSQKKELSFLNRFFSADRAVDAFFIISGYLIMKSHRRSTSHKEYFVKRLKRIYPAYLMVIVGCTLLGCLISTLTPAEYFGSPSLYKYLLSNAFFLNFIQPDLPGVFNGNFFHAVNGSLWTLKVEIGYYLLVPMIAALRLKIKPALLYSCLYLLSVGYFVTMMYLYHTRHQDIFLFLSRQIPGELLYFILGAAVVEFDDKPLFRTLITWLGLPAAILVFFFSLGLIADSLALAVTVFFFSLRVPELHYPFRKEDLSYGLYIYHFPVIQTLIWLGVYDWSAMLGTVMTLLISVMLALISWLFIEKPFISGKTRFKISSFYIPGHNQ